MKEERQIIFHGHYFQEFYLSVNDNVKEKIGYVFRLIKTVEKVSEKFLKQLIKYACSSEEKGHGRRTLRKYEVYDIEQVKKAERWTRSKISTLLKVTRRSVEMKTGKETEETRLLYFAR